MRIKGHTEIQLTDVRTGKVKTFHDDNMMTNGLAEFMKNHGMLCGTPFTDDVKNDLINTLLGGILLFDTALTENVNNTRLADGIKMTANACAGVTHTGDPTELGSYDANESGWQNDEHTVYRHVFTWTTSQGNGRIASACLTSKPHGYIGEGNSTSGLKITDNNITRETYGSKVDIGSRERAYSEHMFMIIDNVAYYLKIDTSAQTITISKVHVTDTECDLRDVSNSTTAQLEEVAVLNNPVGTANLVQLKSCSCRVLSNSVVLAINANNAYKVLKLSSDLTAITDCVDVTPSATSITFNSSDQMFLSADATKLILRNETARKVFKIDLSNLANVSEITVKGNPAFQTNHAQEYLSEGKRHYASDYVYDETLNEIYPLNMSPLYFIHIGDLHKDDATMIAYMSAYNSSSGYGVRNNDYLATINNLSSPVTKDSTQTMKVIYTLTFIA